jgi:hypothetical protein
MKSYIFIIITILQVHYVSAAIYSPTASINKKLSNTFIEYPTSIKKVDDRPTITTKKRIKPNLYNKWLQKKTFDKVKGDNRVLEGFSITSIILLALTVLYFSPAIIGGTFIFTFGFLVSAFFHLFWH